MEVSEADEDEGYHMGVYICIGESIISLTHKDFVPFSHYGSFAKMQIALESEEKLFVLLGEAKHKIKKKAEQCACEKAIIQIEKK